ncbi:leucyl aminopeptidase [Candidatus Babeliales bacterium]|nr:leucyl aminopeptidase [Candidatus Babeliales bacterium]MCF7899223.1 leucyl aminopeptidase [Candidatus Babeliales bacterium]
MLDIQISEKKFWDNNVEGYIFLLKENFESASKFADIDYIEKNYYPNLKEILKKHKFESKKGESFVLTGKKGDKLVQFIFIGLGSLENRWNIELENLRRAVGSAVLLLKKLKIKKSVLAVPNEKPFGLIEARLIRQMIIAGLMADYEFTKFKSDKNKDDEWSCEMLLSVDAKEDQTYVRSLSEGHIIGDAVNLARNLSDMPANIINPTTLSSQAKEIADSLNLECKVFGREKAEELGMGGFLAVDSGSDELGKFVVIEYNTTKKDAPTIALVGKGVTFDSGGISLKPADYMTGMKFDMSGAATVIATMKAIGQLKPEVNVVAVAPMVENMPSGKACKQDDIITFMNGKTAEIKNTDAEGRLILADALCYVEKFYKPDVVLDIATLTGACLYALGHFFTGLMTKDEVLGTKLQAVSLVTGDRVWPLPMDDDFKDAIKSEVADIANTGAPNYKAGTITASWFLSNFVTTKNWAHLDIAGTADGVPGVNYLGKGATGAGVRLFIDFILNYKK